jgi:glycosyltransferase involved in cell wall biosynthesis
MDNVLNTRISALLMIYNEASQIRECIETVKWADEIVVCDSYSTDGTVEICREYTDRIFQREFDNFGDQKLWTLDKPSNEWVLFVEADERFPAELQREIREVLSRKGGYDGFWIPYRHFFLGREMKGKFWDAKRVKLFRKSKGGWQAKMVHSNFVIEGRLGELRTPLLHYSYRDIGVYWTKFNRATTLEAKALLASGKLPLRKTLMSPAWVPAGFIKYFFVWQEYKSGWAGIVFSLLAAPYSLFVCLKYWILLCIHPFRKIWR